MKKQEFKALELKSGCHYLVKYHPAFVRKGELANFYETCRDNDIHIHYIKIENFDMFQVVREKILPSEKEITEIIEKVNGFVRGELALKIAKAIHERIKGGI